MKRALEKYLRRDAEDPPALALLPEGRTWDACVVMPAWREPAEGLIAARDALVEAVRESGLRTLWILVPNHPERDLADGDGDASGGGEHAPAGSAEPAMAGSAGDAAQRLDAAGAGVAGCAATAAGVRALLRVAGLPTESVSDASSHSSDPSPSISPDGLTCAPAEGPWRSAPPGFAPAESPWRSAPPGFAPAEGPWRSAPPGFAPPGSAPPGYFAPAAPAAPLLDLLVLGPAGGVPLPPQQGVGAARRIGMDAALRIWARGALRSRWIRCTDADARLVGPHLSVDVPGAAGLALPFEHEPPADADDALRAAIGLYDLHLRWYAAGLAWAGSPWAWIPIGSAMAVDAEAYAEVRGMPRRAAGEDFAILAKLELVGGVATPDVPPVRVLGRPSDRVPFGTGPAVARIAERIRGGTAVEQAFLLHDPQVFAGVRTWQRVIGQAARTGELPPVEDAVLCDALDALGLRASAEDALAALSAGPALERRLRAEFSALRTLRLVHLLRDASWPDLPWGEALDAAPFGDSLPRPHASALLR